jgi:hypothetical protein
MSKKHLVFEFFGSTTEGGYVEVPGLLVGDRVTGAVYLAPDDRRGWCADEYFARFCWRSDHLLVLPRMSARTLGKNDRFVILVQRDAPHQCDCSCPPRGAA